MFEILRNDDLENSMTEKFVAKNKTASLNYWRLIKEIIEYRIYNTNIARNRAAEANYNIEETRHWLDI